MSESGKLRENHVNNEPSRGKTPGYQYTPSVHKKKNTRSNTWYGLDNAANLFPAISNDRNTNVFRISCELHENIDKTLLQQATDKAMRSFEYFQTIMRRGLFWYYLELTDQTPQVKVESERPCTRIFYSNVKELLFEITYYGKRINLEVFHAIADGGGALELMRTIVYNYIVMAHHDDLPDRLPPLDRTAPPAHMAEDSFEHHYDPKERQSPFRKKCYTISGTALPSNSVQIIGASMPTKQILALAKSKKVTVTAYLSALMICSIYDGLMPRRLSQRSIGVNIPVDLRSHFKSETARNFFSVVDVSYNFEGRPAVFEDVLASVSDQLTDSLDPAKLAKRINYNMSVQKNFFTGVTPLVLKNLILRAAYHKAEAATTCAVSNMGRIRMPEPFVKYIHSFHCLLNPTAPHKVKACVSSFEDQFVINFTSCIAETKAQKYFLRHLSAEGIDITLTCNGGYDIETV
ncbi:MAG: hypothetical protein LBV27_08925 [Oscillospiraceae bacterium]|jgi:hypothetical protein|nr:hypothetical protein [Oscillospiraceae bacterium]